MIDENLLANWLEAKTALERAKELEMQLRMQLAVQNFNFDENKLEKGTENLALANNHKLKCVKTIRYTLATKNDETNQALDAIEATGPEGKFIADRLVKWKPELSVSEYDKLEPKYKAIIDKALTAKASTPTLTLVEPKNK